jgi:hypothetical protein
VRVFLRRIALCWIFILVGCQDISLPALPTPIPTDYLPTAIALTARANAGSPQTLVEEAPASSLEVAVGTPTLQSQETPTASATPEPSAMPSITPTGPSATPYTLPPSPTSTRTFIPSRTPTLTRTPRPTRTPTVTPIPGIPNAEIEIRNLGPLSRVISPLHVYLYLKPGAGGKVLIELLGEEERVLYREVRKIDFVPVGAWATFTLDIDFEIAATAEVGHLKISVDDAVGRTVALNSVPLILLSVGDADIVPPRDVLAPIIIRQPRKKALIQGGKLVVSGLARPDSDQPLMAKLISDQGNEVGFRLVEVGAPGEGGYGAFAAEVPYTVSQPTPALLVLLEGGSSLADVIHLSSIEVLLSP